MVGTRAGRAPASLVDQLLQLRQDVVQVAQLVACAPTADRVTVELAASAAARDIVYLEVLARRAGL